MANKFPLELSHFKKVHEDNKSATLKHPDGHTIQISKGALDERRKKQLATLPNYADGGGVSDFDQIESTQSAPNIDQDIMAAKSAPPPAEYTNILNSYKARNIGGLGGSTEDRAAEDYQRMNDMASADRASLSNSDLGRLKYLQGIAAPSPISQEEPIQAGPSPASQSPSPQPAQYAQQPQPEMPTYKGQGMDVTMGKDIKQYQQGLAGEAQARGDLGKQQAELERQDVAQQEDLRNTYQTNLHNLMEEHKNLVSDYENGHINPNHYMESKSTMGRISSAIGLILGGLGGGLLHQENPALKYLNDNINRDIDSQKADLGKKENLLSANMRMFGNLNDATKMTQANLAGITAAKMRQAAATATDPIAKADMMQKAAQFELQYAPQIQSLALKQTALKAAGQGGTINPAQLVPHLVPETHQKEVFGEIKRAADTRHMSSSIMAAFDQAVKDTSGLGIAGSLIKTPRAIGALHQSLQPTFADLEGTVRQAAMDNTFDNVTPTRMDNASDTKMKRDLLTHYLESKKSAPTAFGFGIDLDKFKSTSTNPEMRLDPQQKQYAEWAKANPHDPRSGPVLRKLGLQ